MRTFVIPKVCLLHFFCLLPKLSNAISNQGLRRVYKNWKQTVLSATSSAVVEQGMTTDFQCTKFEQTIVFTNSRIFIGYHIEWKHNGKLIANNYDGRKKIFDDGEYINARIQIFNTRYVDTGVYGCYLTRYSKNGRFTSSLLGAFQLKVVPPKYLKLPTGEYFNATCNFDTILHAASFAAADREETKIQWRQNGKVRHSGYLVKDSPLRHMKFRASWQTAGIWQCGVKLAMTNTPEDSPKGFYIITEFELAARGKELKIRKMPNRDLLYLAMPVFEGGLYMLICVYILLTVVLFRNIFQRPVFEPKEIENNILDKMIAEHLGYDMMSGEVSP